MIFQLDLFIFTDKLFDIVIEGRVLSAMSTSGYCLLQDKHCSVYYFGKQNFCVPLKIQFLSCGVKNSESVSDRLAPLQGK